MHLRKRLDFNERFYQKLVAIVEREMKAGRSPGRSDAHCGGPHGRDP